MYCFNSISKDTVVSRFSKRNGLPDTMGETRLDCGDGCFHETRSSVDVISVTGGGFVSASAFNWSLCFTSTGFISVGIRLLVATNEGHGMITIMIQSIMIGERERKMLACSIGILLRGHRKKSS